MNFLLLRNSGDIGLSFRDQGILSKSLNFKIFFKFLTHTLLCCSEVFFDGGSRKEVDGRIIDGFSVFKKGIRPEWEDPANRAGSELCCRKSMPIEVLDGYWENLTLGLFLNMTD